jgi:PRC-barrel domain
MVKKCLTAAVGCWFGLHGFGPVLAQNPPPPAPPQERRDAPPAEQERRATEQPRESRYGDAQSHQAYRVKNVLGSKVSIQGNLSIGTVDDMVFADDGYIDYLVVLNEGKYVMVPWQAAKFNFEQRSATVNITQTQFQQVPTFTMQQWPNVYAPGYREKIYGYYNLRPGQERRIERRDNRKGP